MCIATEIPGPTRRVFPPRYDEEDYVEQNGSAEQEEEEEEQSNTLVQQGSSSIVMHTVGPPALGTHHTYIENQVPVPPARAGAPRPNSNTGFKSQLNCQLWILAVVVAVLKCVA